MEINHVFIGDEWNVVCLCLPMLNVFNVDLTKISWNAILKAHMLIYYRLIWFALSKRNFFSTDLSVWTFPLSFKTSFTTFHLWSVLAKWCIHNHLVFVFHIQHQPGFVPIRPFLVAILSSGFAQWERGHNHVSCSWQLCGHPPLQILQSHGKNGSPFYKPFKIDKC